MAKHMVMLNSFLSEDLNEVEEIIEYCLQQEVEYIDVGIIAPIGNAIKNELFYSSKSKEFFCEKLEMLKKRYGNYIQVENNLVMDDLKYINLNSISCDAGSLSLSIKENGEVFPCIVNCDPSLCTGNILDGKYDFSFDRDSLYSNSILMKNMKSTGKYVLLANRRFYA